MRRVAVDGFWIDEHPVTAARVPPLRARDRHVTVAERALDPADYPGRRSRRCSCPGSLVFQKTAGPVDLRDVRSWWAYVPGACWQRPGGPGQHDQRPRPPPRRPRRLRGRRGLRGVGRQVAADRGRVGVRGARRARRRALRLGRRRARRTAGRWRTRGRASSRGRTSKLDGYEGTSPVGRVPAQRLRPVRHGRERLGVDVRLFTARHPARPRRAARREPARRPSEPLAGERSREGDQGRLAPLRAELLPPLPPGGAPDARPSTRRRATSASAASCGPPRPWRRGPSSTATCPCSAGWPATGRTGCAATSSPG